MGWGAKDYIARTERKSFFKRPNPNKQKGGERENYSQCGRYNGGPTWFFQSDGPGALYVDVDPTTGISCVLSNSSSA